MKATAIAPANIALIKYWGKKDEQLRLPINGSISVNLSNLQTITTVEFYPDYQADIITIDGKQDDKETERIIQHLNRIRTLANLYHKAKVVSQSNFPKAAGLASSASGFAALTVAASKAGGLGLSEKKLSILARQGSGSACRSIPDGFVEWLEGDSSETSYAYSLFPYSYWDIAIIVAVLGDEQKKVSSTKGMEAAKASPLLATRRKRVNYRIKMFKKIMKERDFDELGELIEAEAFELHAIALTSAEAIVYWKPETIEIIHLVRELRNEGLPIYFTIDAGPNVYIISEKENTKRAYNELKQIKGIRKIIINAPAAGARLIKEHLF